jgi:hypothetical protein
MQVSTMLYLSSAGRLAGEQLAHRPCQLAPDLCTRPAVRGSSDLPAAALFPHAARTSRGQTDDWFGSPRIRLLAWVSAAGFVLFVLRQSSSRNPAPLLCLELLRDRNVMSSAVIGVFTDVILSAGLYVLPHFLCSIANQTLSATQTGRVMCVYALAAAAIRPLVVGGDDGVNLIVSIYKCIPPIC